MTTLKRIRIKTGLLTLFLLALVAGTAPAATFDLCAGTTTLTMPDGTVVPMWGFSLWNGATCTDVSVPGPELSVPFDDPGLTINLHNTLTVPVSLHILGQQLSNNSGPVFDPASGLRRVMSFAHETAPGGMATYSWNNFRPGTYMVQSGTNPALQVQMGLYTVVTKDQADGAAYAGVPYNTQQTIVFHEVDPALHAAATTPGPSVYGSQYGPGGTVTSSEKRNPRYFLINGAAYPDTLLDPVFVGQRALLRFVNAGLDTHVPQIPGMYMELVAEDGNSITYPQPRYGFELPAAKTMDAILEPDAAGSLALYDARLRLTNAGTAAMGGMLAQLTVGAAPVPADTISILRTRYNGANDQVRVWATSDAAPDAALSVLGSDMGAFIADPRVLNGGYYQYFVPGIAANPGSVTVTSDLGGSATAAVPSTMDPVAAADAYGVDQGAVLTVAAASGLLANDLVGGYLLAAEQHRAMLVAGSGPANGILTLNTDGSFAYTPNAGFSGADSFSYYVQVVTSTNPNLAQSAPATVSLTVNAVNQIPVAGNDAYTANAGETLGVTAPGVLDNDSDPDGGPAPLTAVLASGPASGVLTLNADGSFGYAPNAGAASDSFTYTAYDGAANSPPATVSITINQPPVAVDDTFTTDENTALNGNVLTNDTDDGLPSALTASLATPPSQGLVTLNSDGSFTYTPGNNYSGPDSFTYTASDGALTSSPATVSITVNNVGDTVTITRLRWRPNAQNPTAIRVLATSSAPAGSATLTATAIFPGGTEQLMGGTLTYNANANEYRGNMSFTRVNNQLPTSVRVDSNQGGSDTENVPFN